MSVFRASDLQVLNFVSVHDSQELVGILSWSISQRRSAAVTPANRPRFGTGRGRPTPSSPASAAVRRVTEGRGVRRGMFAPRWFPALNGRSHGRVITEPPADLRDRESMPKVAGGRKLRWPTKSVTAVTPGMLKQRTTGAVNDFPSPSRRRRSEFNRNLPLSNLIYSASSSGCDRNGECPRSVEQLCQCTCSSIPGICERIRRLAHK